MFLSILFVSCLVSCVGDGDFGATVGDCDELCTIYQTAQNELMNEYEVNDRDFPNKEIRRAHIEEIAGGHKIESWFQTISENKDTNRTNFSCIVVYNSEKTTYGIKDLHILTQDSMIYETYCNQRFDYCIDYIDGLLVPQGESDNGDGQLFKDSTNENQLKVFREYRFFELDSQKERLKKAYEEDSRIDNPNLRFDIIFIKELESNFFIISGTIDGKIYYQRTIVKDGDMYTYYIVYNKNDEDIYEKLIERNLKVFK